MQNIRKTRKILCFIGIFLCLIPLKYSFAQSSTAINAGFVPGNIWYSKDPFYDGDQIKIYTLIFDPQQSTLSGTVDFFDQNILLGTKTFSVQAGAVKDISVNWTVTAGTHIIFAKIENAEFLAANGTTTDAGLAGTETEKSSRIVTPKIILGTSDANTDQGSGTLGGSVQNLADTVKNNIPNFISTPIINTTNALETFRQDTAATSDNNTAKTSAEIKTLYPTGTASPTTTTKPNFFLKPFDYVKLFFYSLISFIFNNPYLFYGLLFMLVFFIVRYFWKLFF